MWVQSLGQEDLLEDIATHSSILTWRIPWTEATAYSYYMVWCNDELSVKNPSGSTAITMPRSRLTLAYTEDGIHWEILGDIWCWRSNYTYRYGMLNHLVDPFIYVTDDDVIVGSGLSEKWKVIGEGSSNVHQAQRQHIWRISKDGLVG